jgi:hypothetical protein
MRWAIHQSQARLVYLPENFTIDLRGISARDDIRLALEDLQREPFATPDVISEAQELLINYCTWLRAQDKARKLRKG